MVVWVKMAPRQDTHILSVCRRFADCYRFKRFAHYTETYGGIFFYILN